MIGNLVSHPLIFYFCQEKAFSDIIIAECLVVIFEAIIYRCLGNIKLVEALGVSLILNGCSWGIGRYIVKVLI